MKRTELSFAAFQVLLDITVLVMAGWFAYTVRFDQLTGVLPAANPIPFGGYIRTVIIVAIGWVAILGLAGVYPIRPQRLTAELGRIFLGISTGVLLIIVLIFFQREFFSSRFIILAGWLLAIVFVWLTHLLMRLVRHLLYRRGIGVRQIIVIGNDPTTHELLERVHSKNIGLHVTKHWETAGPEIFDELDELLRSHQIDLVIQADANLPRSQTQVLIDRCLEYNVRFSYAADVFDAHATQVELDSLAGIPVMELKRTPLDGWGRIGKRAFDMLGAVLGLLIACIPGVLIAIAVKLDSAGPIFIRLERVGEGQRRFGLWKFRSMVRNAHAMKSQLMEHNERADGPLFKIANDPRITRVGKFLRKTSLDELPQLWNILRGEMSLVGPRPHEPEEVARYEKHHKKLLTIKPGLTGMAQISGRSNLSFEEEVRLDTYYIEHWSLGLDLTILVRTPGSVVAMKTAA